MKKNRKIKHNAVVNNSKIHGLGLFASRNIKIGERIIAYGIHENFDWSSVSFLSFINLLSDSCMVNHSETPNTHRFSNEMKTHHIIATRGIKIGEEITENYNLLPDWNNPFSKRAIEGVPTKDEYENTKKNTTQENERLENAAEHS